MPQTEIIDVLYDLPSPYVPHPCGLLHLPRFLAKIKKHLRGELPKGYQRNFTKGFDGFLCLHLGIEPSQVIEIVRSSQSDTEIEEKLKTILPKDLKIAHWNRKLVQMGTSEMGKESLQRSKKSLGIENREDIISYADIIDYDEGKIK